MISRQIANISSVIEVLIDIFLATIVAHATSGTIKHSIGIYWVHVIVAAIWLPSTQEVIVDLLIWVDASELLLLQLIHLWCLSNLSFSLTHVHILLLSHWSFCNWHISSWLWISGSIVHLFLGSCFCVVIRCWLVIVIFGIHFKSKM
jgi:hypothetical protein